MTKHEDQDLKITHSEEYETYLRALCHLASNWVSRIRVQFAEKAYEMYQDKTVRKIVLEYGKEIEKLEQDRFEDFRFTSKYGAKSLEDSCLNDAKHYARTIWMLFEIE